MSVPPSNLLDEISSESGVLGANTKSFSSVWNSWKDKNEFDVNPLKKLIGKHT